MTKRTPFRVVAWAGWTPGSEPAPDARALPASLRRRVTPIGRRLLEAAWQVLPQAGDEPRLVLSSRHGEYARTMGLLESLAADGEVSPAEFSLAVHHALAGLLSIASGNHSGHTALAAGLDSFGYGLLEAAACAATDRKPVVLMHYDEPLPADYAPVLDADEPAIALAVVVAPGHEEFAMELEPAAAAGAGGLAAAFLDFLNSGAASAQATGDRMTWRWHRV